MKTVDEKKKEYMQLIYEEMLFHVWTEEINQFKKLMKR